MNDVTIERSRGDDLAEILRNFEQFWGSGTCCATFITRSSSAPGAHRHAPSPGLTAEP
jgi:hypothetical protein